MTCTYYAEIKYNLQLTPREFEIISNNAQHHYDSYLKSQTQAGGFIYGMSNRMSWAANDELPTHDLTDRQFQLLIKSLEMDCSPEAMQLMVSLMAALSV
jgi:hypothetical protein